MTDTMTPPMGVLGGHVLEHLCSCVVGKCPEQPFTNLGVRMRDRSRSALRPGRVEHLGGGVEIQSSNQCCEIAIGEPMHGTGG